MQIHLSDAGEADYAATRADLRALSTRSLSNSVARAPANWLENDGNNLRTEQEQATRWVQHLCEVLNHLPPDDPPQADIALDISISPPTEAEVRLPIKAMKCVKATGNDAIYAEMRKAGLNISTKVHTDICRKI